MSSGLSAVEPVMALFMILKVVSRLKLININYGEIQEVFLGSMGGAFQVSGKGVTRKDLFLTYKSRAKLDLHKIPILSMLSIWDKYLMFYIVMTLGFAVRKMLKY
jgi:hypothetical protein